MATVNKDFRVKHGLIVEGTTATVNGENVLTEGSTEFLEDTAAGVLTGGSHSGISFTYDDENGVVNATVSSTPTFTTSITFEGATADDYETVLQVSDPTADRTITLPNASGTVALTSDVPTTEAIEDIVGAMVSSNTETGITVTYDDENGKLNFAVDALSTEDVQDIVGAMVSSNTETGISVTYEDGDGTLDFAIEDEYVQDVVGAMLTGNTESGISVTYQDGDGTIDFEVNATLGTHTTGNYVAGVSAGTGISVSGSGSAGATVTVTNDGVLSVSGTTDQISASTTSGAVTLSLPSAVVFPGTVTLNADPTLALQAATKQYVDNAVAGLDWHPAVNLLADSNVSLTGSTSTLVIDGHAALDSGDVGYRILLIDQTTDSENGIYVYADNGSTYTLSRAADADVYTELVGSSVFVMEGTTYGTTSWVQSNHYLSDFTSQQWVQFSGSGTYTAGNGILLTGNAFEIDTTVTVDVDSSQTLTNKTLTSPTVSGLYLSDNNIVVEGTDDVHETTVTFTDPTADRTITFQDATGTVALLGTIALGTDTTGNYVASVGTSSGISGGASGSEGAAITLSLDINGLTGEASIADADTLAFYDSSATANRKVTADELRDYVLGGVSGDITIDSSGVASIAANSVALGTDTTGNYVATIAGTTNQVTVTGSGSESAAITLSLPQSIATSSTPEFAALTLTNAAALTMANSSLADNTFTTSGTSAQVVDSWSASSYTSAKYLVQMKLGNDVEVIEILVTVDGNNNVYLTEYADVYSNTVLGLTDAVYNGGSVELKVTPTTTGTVVKVHRTLIEA